MGSTSQGLRYPEPTDRLNQVAQFIEDLAEDVDGKVVALDGRLDTIEPQVVALRDVEANGPTGAVVRQDTAALAFDAGVRWQKVGRLVHLEMDILVQPWLGAGVSGARILVQPPTAISDVVAAAAAQVHGVAEITRPGTALYRAICKWEAAQGAWRFDAMHLTGADPIGADPAFSLSGSHTINMVVDYEVSSA